MLNEAPTPPPPAPDARDDRVDASGPDRLVFVATLLVGVAFLSSVFLTDESAIDTREARISRIERRMRARDARDELAGYRDSERDAARMISALALPQTGPWRSRVERGPPAGDALEAPPPPRAELIGDGTTVELTWQEIEGIDGVHVYRTKRAGQAARQVTERPVPGTRWSDELKQLTGRYVYELRAVRGEEQSSPSPPVEVPFQLRFDWKIVAVAPDGRAWADVEVTPESDRIRSQRLRVAAGDDLNETGLRVARIEATSETRRRTKTAPVFAPNGTRMRGPDGKPLTQTIEEDVSVPITRVVAVPIAGGDPVVRTHQR